MQNTSCLLSSLRLPWSRRRTFATSSPPNCAVFFSRHFPLSIPFCSFSITDMLCRVPPPPWSRFWNLQGEEKQKKTIKIGSGGSRGVAAAAAAAWPGTEGKRMYSTSTSTATTTSSSHHTRSIKGGIPIFSSTSSSVLPRPHRQSLSISFPTTSPLGKKHGKKNALMITKQGRKRKTPAKTKKGGAKWLWKHEGREKGGEKIEKKSGKSRGSGKSVTHSGPWGRRRSKKSQTRITTSATTTTNIAKSGEGKSGKHSLSRRSRAALLSGSIHTHRGAYRQRKGSVPKVLRGKKQLSPSKQKEKKQKEKRRDKQGRKNSTTTISRSSSPSLPCASLFLSHRSPSHEKEALHQLRRLSISLAHPLYEPEGEEEGVEGEVQVQDQTKKKECKGEGERGGKKPTTTAHYFGAKHLPHRSNLHRYYHENDFQNIECEMDDWDELEDDAFFDPEREADTDADGNGVNLDEYSRGASISTRASKTTEMAKKGKGKNHHRHHRIISSSSRSNNNIDILSLRKNKENAEGRGEKKKSNSMISFYSNGDMSSTSTSSSVSPLSCANPISALLSRNHSATTPITVPPTTPKGEEEAKKVEIVMGMEEEEYLCAENEDIQDEIIFFVETGRGFEDDHATPLPHVENQGMNTLSSSLRPPPSLPIRSSSSNTSTTLPNSSLHSSFSSVSTEDLVSAVPSHFSRATSATSAPPPPHTTAATAQPRVREEDDALPPSRSVSFTELGKYSPFDTFFLSTLSSG